MNHRRFPAALKLLIVVTASAATESARVDILAAVNGGFGRCVVLGLVATGCGTVVAHA
jgi:hypothetical protein